MTSTIDSAPPAVTDQQALLMSHLAGYTSHRTIAMGLRSGLVRAAADTPGATAEQLAASLRLDPFYVAVWCRAAIAAGVLDRAGDGYELAPHMATLLLDAASPAYAGGTFAVLEHPEVFTRFEASLGTGERMWWDQTSDDWISGVSETGTGFYLRLVPGGLAKVPGLADALASGGRIVDTACGAGIGMIRLAGHYPSCQIVGIDGDARSVTMARRLAEGTPDAGRIQLHCGSLEEMALAEPATLIINNISMHECRDIDRATRNIWSALAPGGWFVISDFPFPDTDEGLRTPAGRVMSGIQFFEAQIDDQLLPRAAYDGLLHRHGFVEIGSHQLTPMHAITYGRRPVSG